jgi:hypothetical protein
MCKEASSPRTQTWDYVPSLFGVLALLYMLITLVFGTPPLLTRDSYTVLTDSDRETRSTDVLEAASADASEGAKQALVLVWNLSNYATTSSTLLFAAFGAFVVNFRPKLKYIVFLIPVVCALALLVGAHVNGYLANSEAISELAEGRIALVSGDSKIIYYLEREAWLALLSILTIVITFVVIARQSFKP